MRLLHIAKYAHPEPGGMETFVRDLAAEQTRQGHAASVLCHQAGSLLPSENTRENGITTIRCATLWAAPFAPLAPTFPLCLRTALRQERPEIIHLHLPNPAALFQAFLPRNIPLVVHWHADAQGSSNAAVRAAYPAYRFFEQRCLAMAAAVAATSPPYLESSPSLAPWRNKCSVIPLGLDASRYPEEAAPEPKRPLVLGVGRLAFYKGFEHLVRAAALVPEADFVIAGHGPKRRAIQEEIRRLGLDGRVSLPGAVTDRELRRLLQQAAAFCLPSVDRAEAFGMVLLEAMRYGLPVISTAIPGSGTGWVNRDGETGFVVPPADPEALAGAVRKLLGDPAKRARLGQAGQQRFEENFRIEAVARAVTALYEHALSA